MPSLPLYDISKKKVGQVDLNDAIFAGEVKPYLINDAVRAQIAWRYEFRTANSLTRSEVTGSRKKMFKQKGTGQARHGIITAPIFVGGGKAHGPKPRRVKHKINKKVMKAALCSTLTLNQKEDRLFVIDTLALEKVSVKAAAQFMKSLGIDKALVVNGNESEAEKAFNRSFKNLKAVKLISPDGVNVFDLLKFKNLVISQAAVKKLSERLTNV